jgi:hypothetical protein
MLAQAKKQSTVNLGEHIITSGLATQCLWFIIFMIVTVIFHVRMAAMPTLRSKQLSVPWASYLYVLYGASIFILTRSIFRIAEYVMGTDGVLLDHEYYLYIFDSTLMFFVMVIFNVWHPSRIIAGSQHLDGVDGHQRAPESQDSGYELAEHSVHVSQHGKH